LDTSQTAKACDSRNQTQTDLD